MTGRHPVVHPGTMITNLDEALVLYLPSYRGFQDYDPDNPTRAQLLAAAKAAAQWRIDGPRATAFVLQALRDDGMTFRQIEQETSIDHVTVQRMISRLEEKH